MTGVTAERLVLVVTGDAVPMPTETIELAVESEVADTAVKLKLVRGILDVALSRLVGTPVAKEVTLGVRVETTTEVLVTTAVKDVVVPNDTETLGKDTDGIETDGMTVVRLLDTETPAPAPTDAEAPTAPAASESSEVIPVARVKVVTPVADEIREDTEAPACDVSEDRVPSTAEVREEATTPVCEVREEAAPPTCELREETELTT